MNSKVLAAMCLIFAIFILEVAGKRKHYLIETKSEDTGPEKKRNDSPRCLLKRKDKYEDACYSIRKAIRGKNLQKIFSKNPRECQKQCLKDPECSHWSFIKNFYKTNEKYSNKRSKCFPYGGKCSLKNDDEKLKTKKNPNAISGPKNCKPPKN